MDAGEVRAIGGLAGQALSRPAATARDVHRAFAGRVFGALGVLGAPARVMHDAISTSVYAVTGAALKTPVATAAASVAKRVTPSARSIADSPLGGMALGALNGAFGDRVARDHRELALETTIRVRDRAIVTDSEGLAAAFPDATPKLAVFVHGLCGTEHYWGDYYASRLRADLGYTPVYVRYNTGLHISDNGRRLAELIDHVVGGWPVRVDDVLLIGHSMGGLVSRSAVHYGEQDGRAWIGGVRHVFCLGSPHLGAPLERLANRGAWALGRLPETRPFADLLNGRSVGIKDLRFGNCVEEDWCDCDPDEYLRDRCNEVPFLKTATYCFVGATLTRDPDHPVGRVIGDMLVQYPSACGEGPTRRIGFEIDNGRHLGGVNHLQLLNHPVVYEQMCEWLGRPPRPVAVSATGELPAAGRG